jgi:ribonuclease R
MASKKVKSLTGTLLFNRRGGGARLIGDNDKLLAWIDGDDVANALHGDQVEAVSTRGDMARITRVIQRGRESLVGTYQKQKSYAYLLPDDPRIPCNILIRPGGPALDRPPRVGDKIVVKLEPWKDPKISPAGQIVELLGAPDDTGVDMLSVIRAFDLPAEFSAAVLREADAFSETIAPGEVKKREDCRRDFVLTIDPDDAKDHDDAVYVEKLKTGWRLSVHIADVAHYVRPGTALDREARHRGNSTYLADRCLPMLPLRLSADLCSLREGVDRLAHTAFIEFTTEGKPRKVRFAKTIIRVAKRLTYRQAKQLLDTRGKRHEDSATAQLAHALHTAWDLASILRRRRFAAGSLDLDFPETKVVLDRDGRVQRIEKIENDESHQLVEEFMLAANEAVAREIKNRLAPCVYRVHEKPDPERLEEFRQFAATQGLRVGDLKVRKEVQRMLESLHGRPDEHRLKVEFLKSLRRAAYSADPLGHYGLAKADYLHFTSPIRRYADLIAHRVLAHERAGGRKELMEMAEHISDTERNSAGAEQESVLIKKLEYFQRQLDARRPDEYRAVVSEVKSAGLLVEVTDIDVMGFVQASMLPGGPYEFDRTRARLFNRRSGRKYAPGDTLQVYVCRVDAAQRQIDFAAA